MCYPSIKEWSVSQYPAEVVSLRSLSPTCGEIAVWQISRLACGMHHRLLFHRIRERLDPP
jgi:hypothetical protein